MKPLARFEQRYLISPEGFILNLASNIPLQPSVNPNGYLKVGLACGDGTHEQYLLHVLVAKHFIPNPYDHPTVNHKNGIKSQCYKENLEWASHAEQVDHALRTGLRPGYMSADDKEAYLHEVLDGVEVNEIAQRIGRRPETLHKMLRTTADRLNVRHLWDAQMKENRSAAAIRNLETNNFNRALRCKS
jgi:hypothetical protein